MSPAKLWIALCTTIVLFGACSKSKYSGIPQIALKSVNASVIPVNDLLVVTFTLTEGSYNANDSLYVIVTQTNDPFCPDTVNPYSYPMTSFASGLPSKTGTGFKGDMIVSLSNGEGNSAYGYPNIFNPCNSADTVEVANFAFYVGLEGAYSDTIQIGPIQLLNE